MALQGHLVKADLHLKNNAFEHPKVGHRKQIKTDCLRVRVSCFGMYAVQPMKEKVDQSSIKHAASCSPLEETWLMNVLQQQPSY